MSRRLVLLPGTPLLVPGAAGRTDVLAAERAAAVRALADLICTGVPLVVVAVAAPGAGRSGSVGPVASVAVPVRASLAAAGIADAWIHPEWRPTATDAGAPGAGRVVGTGASVALCALAAARRTVGGAAPTTRVVELDPGLAPDAGAAIGRELGDRGERACGVVVADDPRCPALGALVAAFVTSSGSVGQDEPASAPR